MVTEAAGGAAQQRATTAAAGEDPWSLTLDAGLTRAHALEVLRVAGFEEASRPFRFDVEVRTLETDLAALEADLLGHPATLALRSGGLVERAFHGVVSRIEPAAHGEGGAYTRLAVRLVPRLWLLGRGRNSRIFQDRSVPEIVEAVLRGHGVACAFRLGESYAPRRYCTQHQESDYAFVARILGEEGIFFVFEHPADDGAGISETVVFMDGPRQYAELPGDSRLVLGEHDAPANEQHVHDVAYVRAVRAGRSVITDYDFLQPTVTLSASARVDSPARRADTTPYDEGALERYEHHGEFEGTRITRGAAGVQLSQHRARARRIHGASACRRLAPARWFGLEGAFGPGLDGEWVLTRVEHSASQGRGAGAAGGAGARGSQAATYANRFEAVARAATVRPRRPRRRLQQVLETALVVGPAGEDVHTDAHGRIKVQFHWDREGRRDEHSSCWIRPMQGWAGSGFGAQFVPRVGMEVLVGFLGGDADRPVVLGCAYNGTNAPPFVLPHAATRSGFRTRSVPGGEGYNELAFEDEAGGEQVLLRAQGDLGALVLRDVRADVRGTSTVSITGDAVTTVGGSHVEVVRGSRAATVMGDEAHDVLGGSARSVDGEARETVKGDAHAVYERTRAVHALGGLHVEAGAAGHPAEVFVRAVGNARVASEQTVRLVGREAISLQCGPTRLDLTPEGLAIYAKSVTVHGEDEAVLRTSGTALALNERTTLMSDMVTLWSRGARLALDDGAELRGGRVSLVRGGGQSEATAPPDEATESAAESDTLVLSLTDDAGAPLAGEEYVVVFPNGEERRGRLGDDGRATLRAVPPGDARVYFPHHVLTDHE